MQNFKKIKPNFFLTFKLARAKDHQKKKKKNLNYAAGRVRQSSLAGAVYTQSQSRFQSPRKERFWVFLIIYYKNYTHLIKM